MINIYSRLPYSERLDALPPEQNTDDLSFGNSVYRIRFDDRDRRPVFGHRYWFYLKDAVDDVPEYIVQWENFVQCVSNCVAVYFLGPQLQHILIIAEF